MDTGTCTTTIFHSKIPLYPEISHRAFEHSSARIRQFTFRQATRSDRASRTERKALIQPDKPGKRLRVLRRLLPIGQQRVTADPQPANSDSEPSRLAAERGGAGARQFSGIFLHQREQKIAKNREK